MQIEILRLDIHKYAFNCKKNTYLSHKLKLVLRSKTMIVYQDSKTHLSYAISKYRY